MVNRKPEIKKINRKSVSQEAFENMQSRILSGVFEPGERLPSETQLAEMYGISRLSMRSALQKLSMLGLIEIRVGEGSFVQPFFFDNLMRQVSELISQSNFYQYLHEFRAYIEKDCIELAVAHATAQDLAELEEVARQLCIAAYEGDAKKYIEIDYQFHYHLTKMSHNPLFEMVYSSIKDLFRKFIISNVEHIMLHNRDGLLLKANYHKNFIEYIRARDIEAALDHLDTIITLAGIDQEETNPPQI